MNMIRHTPHCLSLIKYMIVEILTPQQYISYSAVVCRSCKLNRQGFQEQAGSRRSFQTIIPLAKAATPNRPVPETLNATYIVVGLIV